MYETSGLLYLLWLTTWPLTRLALFFRPPTEFGLKLPVRSDYGPTDEYRRAFHWWKVHIWKSSRRVVSNGRGGLAAILLTVLSFLLPPAAWITNHFLTT